MRVSRTMASWLTAASVLATAACGGDGDGGDSGTAGSALQTVKVASASTSLSGMPLAIANERGYFKEQGIRVESIDFKNSPESLAALQSGDVDLANSAGLVQMQVNGNTADDRKDLFKVYQMVSKGLWRVLVNPDVGVTPGGGLMEGISKLKGKTVGIPGPGGEGTEVIKYLVAKAGLDPKKDVKYVTVGVGAPAVSAYRAGQVDAVITIPPVNFMLEDVGAVTVYNMATDDDLPEFTPWDQTAYVASAAQIEKKSEAFKKFNAAMDQAMKYIEDPANEDEVISMWRKINPADEKLLRKSLQAGMADFANGEVDCAGVTNSAKFGVAQGLIKQAQALDCKQLSWTGIADRLTNNR
jgi:ABC-type nitrate/sulfonate/bicarbonate transport system substrate-binding protein